MERFFDAATYQIFEMILYEILIGLYHGIRHSYCLLSGGCGNLILPTAIDYVYFYMKLNFRNLLYVILTKTP